MEPEAVMKWTDELESMVEDLVLNHRRIDAVKLIREVTGFSLRDSKVQMESVIDKLIKEGRQFKEIPRVSETDQDQMPLMVQDVIATCLKIPGSFTLKFERRKDGGLRVYSPEIPGFVLSHRYSALVIEDMKNILLTSLRLSND